MSNNGVVMQTVDVLTGVHKQEWFRHASPRRETRCACKYDITKCKVYVLGGVGDGVSNFGKQKCATSRRLARFLRVLPTDFSSGEVKYNTVDHTVGDLAQDKSQCIGASTCNVDIAEILSCVEFSTRDVVLCSTAGAFVLELLRYLDAPQPLVEDGGEFSWFENGPMGRTGVSTECTNNLSRNS